MSNSEGRERERESEWESEWVREDGWKRNGSWEKKVWVRERERQKRLFREEENRVWNKLTAGRKWQNRRTLTFKKIRSVKNKYRKN